MGEPGYNIFAGHLGHLSATQEAALAQFKSSLTEAKFYDPENPGRLDDPTLLRFLRARSFDPAAALKQFSDSMEWRKQNDVDNLYATFDVDEMEDSRRFYPRWTGRRDKNGMPIYVYRIASLDSKIQKDIHGVPPARRFQRIIVLYEYMVRFALPLCTHLPHSTQTPITCVMTIIDLENVSIGSMWTLRSHLAESAKLATANYPETLSTIAIVNAPSFFPTIWGWIKGWFDPGTRNKIHILGKTPKEDLLKLIDEENLPRPYGGALDWEYKDEPVLDQDAKDMVGGQLPRGPHVFVDGQVGKP
ncbi:Sec14 cytosolic factor [Mycena chlorophos]|uniref:Sec14 cytosolic factor n=1 Tax=Mycena chlorophos TaxID=658473 RepID=A0A8H6SCR3_MYCCL|nr:Sec14 cytosolic factor [Mycena chlorophos]